MHKSTIGFFGDSFCSEEEVKWTNTNDRPLLFWQLEKYPTYIELLSLKYNAEIQTVGYQGSSVYDIVLNQLYPFLNKNKFPDICVFVWTNPGRLYHKDIRSLNFGSVNEVTSLNPIYKAAKLYYEHIANNEKEELEYLALLQYVDNNILPKMTDSKIIHLWSFGKNNGWDRNSFHPNNLKYHYNWKNGIEIRPSMMTMGIIDCPFDDMVNKYFPNHIRGSRKNINVARYISNAIDNYKNGSIVDYSKEIENEWEYDLPEQAKEFFLKTIIRKLKLK